MSKTLSHTLALEDISNWSTSEVLSLLRKNGLDDCCETVQKRRIDGDELLHLTQGKLALWKSDLTRPLTWSLWKFVEEIKKNPEKYVAEKDAMYSHSEEMTSDSGSWGTDFEDDEDDEDDDDDDDDDDDNNNNDNDVDVGTPSSPLAKNNNDNILQSPTVSKLLNNGKRSRRARNKVTESTYTNCVTDMDPPEDESAYANCAPAETKFVAPKYVSNLHSKSEKSFAEQLKEQLKKTRKPLIESESEVITAKPEIPDPKQPQKSFLHAVAPALQQNVFSEKPSMSTTEQATKKKLIGRSENDLPRPPDMICNFDLVANLPTKTEESEGEYETFDEQIIEQNQRLSRGKVDGERNLNCSRQNSVENAHKAPSIVNREKKDEEYEIYESITEAPEDNDHYVQPIERGKTVEETPPPLPAKPTNASISPSPTLNRSSQEKKDERSPDKKSATLPNSGNGTSLLAELRATRPLPPPPEKQSYMDSPWFHNVTREQATTLIKDRPYGNARNGYFLLRPSTSHPNNPLALVLWFKDRVYNVPVRKRPDNRYALGSAKVNEQSFASVEDIVKFYSREELVLHSGGVQTGSIKLTDTPPK